MWFLGFREVFRARAHRGSEGDRTPQGSLATEALLGDAISEIMAVDGCSASRALVTLSLGTRPFLHHTRPLMEAYATRVGAAFHIVDTREHPSLQAAVAIGKESMRFLKLPLLAYYLQRYDRVLYLDDDVIIGPAMADLYAAVPCDALGATVEQHKPQSWHAMHWRSACSLYGIVTTECEPKRWRLFNSGVMMLSRRAHGRLLSDWRRDEAKLQCRVLCDQLYLNALVRREQVTLRDLGAPFNYVGSELRRALVTTGSASPPSSAEMARRRSALRDACVLHLTRKLPKLYTADWVARRALAPAADVLQCTANASWPPKANAWRRQLLARLPPSLAHKYDFGAELCKGEPPPCALRSWASVMPS